MGCFASKPTTKPDRQRPTLTHSKDDDRSKSPPPLSHQSTNPIQFFNSFSDEVNAPNHSPAFDMFEYSEGNQNHAPASMPNQSPFLDPTESSSSSDEENLNVDPIESEGEAATSANDQGNKMKEYGFKELAEATEYFSNNCLLGEGGFGQVFKATLDGEEVAIKKLKRIQMEGKLDEDKYLLCVNHPNIVKMIGHCTQGADRLLVLEFVPNNNLTDHLHDENKMLEWSTRMKIAIQSAKGLLYLHQCTPKIIHRDIKADNILLDNNFEPKVADFSLAYFLPNTVNVNHITSVLRGTNVYADPEYGDIQRVSEKSDIYSFGVVLLELITGRKPIDNQGGTIINWARHRIGRAIDNKDYNDLVDSKLQDAYEKQEMFRMVCCAAASVYKPSHSRPIIKQIIRVLEGTISPAKIIKKKDIETLQGRATTDLESVLDVERIQITPQKIFTYKELAKATGGFSNVNVLGVGGFGQVFKGTFQNGEVVAIKKLKSSYQSESEFLEEIETRNHAYHKHVVKLIGYCSDRANRLLVYDFVPNKSLRYNLHEQNRIINWPTRMKIAIGTAKGLAYLHEICKIMHGNIKSTNILLDQNFEPKISDFALAKVFSNVYTYMSTRLTVTDGYLCPEFGTTRQLSDKSDVYSFGIVLLELITGKPAIIRDRNVPMTHLASWVTFQLRKSLGTHSNIVDVKLRNTYKIEEVVRMIHCAMACVYKPAIYRPKMSQIVEVLQGKLASESIWLSSDNAFMNGTWMLSTSLNFHTSSPSS